MNLMLWILAIAVYIVAGVITGIMMSSVMDENDFDDMVKLGMMAVLWPVVAIMGGASLLLSGIGKLIYRRTK